MSRGADHDDADGAGGFLGRWSKRKAHARERPESATPEPRESSADMEARAPAPELNKELKKDVEAFDLSKLPSLDEITSQTSLSDFMRKEVPAALRNAALKKAWALDPVIRDYVNPAMEYAYDWNAPGGVPGNGPIDTAIETLREMVASAQSAPTDHTLGERESTDVAAEEAETDPSTAAQEPSAVRLSDARESGEAAEKTYVSENVPEVAAPSRMVSV
jgi:hypothetical protein